MPIDLRKSLRRHYTAFLAVLVTGIVLIMAVNGPTYAAELYINSLLGVAGLIAGYVLAPPDPSRPTVPETGPGVGPGVAERGA